MPQAGESFQVVSDITKAQSISQHRQMLSRQAALLQTTKRGIEALGETEVKELLVIIKADEDVEYGAVMGAMDELRAGGIEDMGLITDPKSRQSLLGGGGN